MSNTYIDPFEFTANPTGQEYGSLVGSMAHFTSTQTATSMTLTILSTQLTVALSAYDSLYIFDGGNSEVVRVSSAVLSGATSIPLVSPLQFTHAAGIAWCVKGVMGDLGFQLFSASAWLENICKQSLLQRTLTGETLRMPGMRAAIDNQNMLVFRPRYYPVTLESGITIEASTGNPITYDATQAIVDVGQQVVTVPWLTVSGSSQGSGSYAYSMVPSNPRQQQLWLKITYQAGYAYASLPMEIKEACILLVSHILAKRQNPSGSAEVDSGGRRNASVLRGDTSGESLHFKNAHRILDTYTVKPF